jgi:hypothetical protein
MLVDGKGLKQAGLLVLSELLLHAARLKGGMRPLHKSRNGRSGILLCWNKTPPPGNLLHEQIILRQPALERFRRDIDQHASFGIPFFLLAVPRPDPPIASSIAEREPLRYNIGFC